MGVPTSITDLNVSEASNSPAGSDTVTVANGPDNYLRALAAIIRREQAQATATASGATVNIGAIATGSYVHITGTTGITAFDTVAAGVSRILVFDDALTITHNATKMILPGGTDITTAAGDVAEFVSEGSGNWRCVRIVSQTLTNKTLVNPVISMSTSVTTLDGTETFPVTQTTAKKSTIQKILDWMLARANTWTGTQTFSGDTSVPTQTTGDASNKIANTSFVQTALTGVTWTIKTTTYTAVSGNNIQANTTGGAFTITLPSTPSAGAIVRIADYAGTFPTNALTINWNGAKHKGLSDATMTINYLPAGTLDMVYVDSTIGWTF